MACNFKSFALPVCIQQNIIFYAIDELHGFFSWNTRFLPFPVQHHFTISKIKIYVYHVWINAFHIKLLLSFHKITLSYFPKYTYLECPAKRTNILEFSKQKTAILKYSRNILSCKNTSYTFMVYITCIMYWRNIKTSTSWYEHLFFWASREHLWLLIHSAWYILLHYPSVKVNTLRSLVIFPVFIMLFCFRRNIIQACKDDDDESHA